MTKNNLGIITMQSSKISAQGDIFNERISNDEALLMHQGRLESIIKNLHDTIKELNIQEGEILNLSGENHRVMVSPYRLTLELRFPDGLNEIKQ
jgi:hypothetical protein